MPLSFLTAGPGAATHRASLVGAPAAVRGNPPGRPAGSFAEVICSFLQVTAHRFNGRPGALADLTDSPPGALTDLT
ncbi:MAG: hypothetical protein J2P35_11945, partial [Actinobacteria bacterium]|nr:hypothetical protein [Actinomycetota bacterium]